MTIKAYVTNLKAYNEGELLGEWVEFPATYDDILKLEKRLNVYIYDNEDGDEYFFTDFETDCTKLYRLLKEHMSLESLNEIAERLDNIPDDDAEIFNALLDDTGDIDDALEKYENNEYIYYHDCSSMAAVAERYCAETGILDQIPEGLQQYFNFEDYGYDMDMGGNFYELCNGYIEIL